VDYSTRTRTWARADRTVVLCYHAVSETWDVPLAVTASQLAEQLELITRRGYRTVTFHEAVAAPPSGPTLAITFDDGFASVLELAFPILSSLDMVATVFVVTDLVDSGKPLDWPGIDQGGGPDRDVRGLSWAELEQLAEAGWEVGSHTRTHPRLTQLDDETLADELRGSRAACERALAGPCRSLAYPFGDVDMRVVEAAREAGYEAAASLPTGVVGGSALEWPRIGVNRKDSLRRFRLKVSPTALRVRQALAPVERLVRA
jgi:peptidoglycan/xylan/chitin deacetylase (PgdA/CDA1 family)